MEEASTSEEQVVKALYVYTAELLTAGRSESDVVARLVEKGLSHETAWIVVRDVAQVRSEAKRSSGKRNMLIGALWCVGGILVTALTYSAASGGGTYVVAYGAIAVGAVQFVIGAVQAATQPSS